MDGELIIRLQGSVILSFPRDVNVNEILFAIIFILHCCFNCRINLNIHTQNHKSQTIFKNK